MNWVWATTKLDRRTFDTIHTIGCGNWRIFALRTLPWHATIGWFVSLGSSKNRYSWTNVSIRVNFVRMPFSTCTPIKRRPTNSWFNLHLHAYDQKWSCQKPSPPSIKCPCERNIKWLAALPSSKRFREESSSAARIFIQIPPIQQILSHGPSKIQWTFLYKVLKVWMSVISVIQT